MAVTPSTVLKLVALFVVAPIGAAVIISALLLLGASPQRVFLPGTVVMSALKSLGFGVANPVGVVTTVILWWAIIVVSWVGLRRVLRRP